MWCRIICLRWLHIYFDLDYYLWEFVIPFALGVCLHTLLLTFAWIVDLYQALYLHGLHRKMNLSITGWFKRPHWSVQPSIPMRICYPGAFGGRHFGKRYQSSGNQTRLCEILCIEYLNDNI